jgi:hypothetical protein
MWRMSIGAGQGPRWWRGRPSYVVWPALIGLVFCVLAILGYRLEARNYSDFASHSAKTVAVIDSFYYGAEVASTGNPPWYSQFATVHYSVGERRVTANVMLVPQCFGACVPVYQVGDRIKLAYNTRQPSRAVYPIPSGRLSLNPLAWNSLVFFAAVIGVGALIIAILNIVFGTVAPARSGHARKRRPDSRRRSV